MVRGNLTPSLLSKRDIFSQAASMQLVLKLLKAEHVWHKMGTTTEKDFQSQKRTVLITLPVCGGIDIPFMSYNML